MTFLPGLSGYAREEVGEGKDAVDQGKSVAERTRFWITS